jgi:hypothetical protein
MKAHFHFGFLLVILAIPAGGCRDKTADPMEQAAPMQPKRAASQLDNAFAAAPADVQSFAKAASDSLQKADYESAVQSLQMIKEQGGLTVDQGLAVHNSMISLEAKLINAMVAGDPNAKRAYDQLKKARKN